MSKCKWVKCLNDSIAENMKVNKDSISYCLSTVSHPQSSAQPESRFCVHRGFVNERRKSDDVSPNPDKPEQIGTALLVCTDIRSPKIDQLLDRKLDTQVGQPASICWWFAATGEQYRIQTKAFVVPPPCLQDQLPQFDIELQAKLSPSNLGSETFDWEHERRRIFEKISPELKASFLRPTPGEPLDRIPSDASPSQWPSEITSDYQKTCALERFALIVLDPVSVDLVKLKAHPNERLQWKKLDNGTWAESYIVP